jgi:hypothetical protein
LFTFGHVRQLDAVTARLLPALARATPVLPGADQYTVVDIDDTCGRPTAMPSRAPDAATPASKVSTRLLAVVSTPLAAPLIAAARLRKGSTNSARGRGEVGDRGAGHRAPHGAVATVLVRADSAYYGHANHRRLPTGRSAVLDHHPA